MKISRQNVETVLRLAAMFSSISVNNLAIRVLWLPCKLDHCVEDFSHLPETDLVTSDISI